MDHLIAQHNQHKVILAKYRYKARYLVYQILNNMINIIDMYLRYLNKIFYQDVSNIIMKYVIDIQSLDHMFDK